MLIGTQLRGPAFGVGDRPFIVTVRLTNPGVMTVASDVGFRLPIICLASHLLRPFHNPFDLRLFRVTSPPHRRPQDTRRYRLGRPMDRSVQRPPYRRDVALGKR